MKPLKNHVIIYDAECPMCAIYTGAFTQYGWLEKNGRWKYSEIEQFEGCHLVDRDKSRHEIALVDLENKTVHYGLDSMLFIIAYKLPFLKPLFENSVFQAVMKQVYSLISYNRKVIAPSSKESEQSCIPDFHIFYRFAYIMVALYLALIGFYYVGNSYDMGITMILGIAGFWVLNVLSSIYVMQEKALIYLGQLATIFLIGVLLSLPIAIGTHFLGHSLIGEIIAFSVVASVLIPQIIRRVKIAWRDYKKLTFTMQQFA